VRPQRIPDGIVDGRIRCQVENTIHAVDDIIQVCRREVQIREFNVPLHITQPSHGTRTQIVHDAHGAARA
jgi:hypothetical protein